MAKKVLNVSHRDALRTLAARLVKETQDSGPMDAAYEAAADMVAGLVEKKYPKKDMEVLRKYECGRLDSCVYVSPGHGGMEQFKFRPDDQRTPHVPDRYCNQRTPYLMDEAQEALFDAWQRTTKEYNAAVKARIGDFHTVIAMTRTFEDLVEIWPAAEALREKICGPNTALVTLNEETLARLKADPAAALKEPA